MTTTDAAPTMPALLAELQRRNAPAYMFDSGGCTMHVAVDLPDGGMILADDNEGEWIIGVYAGPVGLMGDGSYVTLDGGEGVRDLACIIVGTMQPLT